MWLILAALATAQEAPIDLAKALTIALRDGVDAHEATFAREAAESTLAQRRLAGLPTLNGAASAGLSLGSTGVSPGASVSLSSTTPLYAGGAIGSDRASAAASLAAARADEARVEQDLHLALAGSLLDLAGAAARVDAAASTLVAEEALATRIERLVAAGSRTRADLLQQAAAVAKAKATKITAERDAARAELSLEEVLRLDPARRWVFSPPRVGPAVAGDFTALTEEARGHRPELVAARAELAQAEAELRGAGSGGLPAVDLVVGASAGLSAAPGGSATIRASVPIFNRGVAHDTLTRARLARDSAQLAFDAAGESVAYAVRGALVDRDAASSNSEAAEARWLASDAAARVVSDRYDAGAATFAELLAARAELADAERERISAHIAVERSKFALAWAVGAL